MKIYLSGPMRGIPEFNFPAFDAAAKDLRAQGHDVWSPVDHDREVWPTMEIEHPGFATGTEIPSGDSSFRELIKADIRAVTDQDAIALLPGWQDSSGARIERRVAEDCGLAIYHVRREPGGWHYLVREQPPLVLGLSGYGQAGKDTAGAVMQEYGFTRLSFADALRSLALAVNPIVKRTQDEPPFLQYGDTGTLCTPEWESTAQQVYADLGQGAYEWLKRHTNYRDVLTGIGGGARDVLGQDVWVDAVKPRLQPGRKYVITDVRYPNEAALCTCVVRIERYGANGIQYGPVTDHESETALDEWPFDFIITNHDGHKAVYEATVREFAQRVGWQQ